MTSPPLRKQIEALWYGRSPLAWLLLPFAWCYGLVVRLRRWAYQSGVLATPALRLPVVVVGNIAVGGTGKTPVVGWLAVQLRERGLRVGIVSRGYGGRESAAPRRVTADSSPAEVGDEPVLLARVTQCPVVVCTRRVRAVELLYESGVDVVLADDGLQHYALARVAELVVVDAARGLGNGLMLPAGPLREPASRLRSSTAVLLNGQSDGFPSALEFTLEQAGAERLDTAASAALTEFAGQRVWAVAGIGNPQRFFGGLREQGIEVDEVMPGDHATTNLEALLRTRQQPILMTEKDAVKYTAAPAATWVVPVQVRFSSDAAAVERLLNLLEQRIAAFQPAENA